jgi:hypothetical protein
MTYAEAMQRPDAQKWKRATDDEFEQHVENETFELVELPLGRTILDGKWVFKIKCGANNEILKYKARWVARGFMQQFGIDYDQTYAGVVRAIFSTGDICHCCIIRPGNHSARLCHSLPELAYQ